MKFQFVVIIEAPEAWVNYDPEWCRQMIESELPAGVRRILPVIPDHEIPVEVLALRETGQLRKIVEDAGYEFVPESSSPGLNRFWLSGRWRLPQVVVYSLWLVTFGFMLCKWLKQ